MQEFGRTLREKTLRGAGIGHSEKQDYGSLQAVQSKKEFGPLSGLPYASVWKNGLAIILLLMCVALLVALGPVHVVRHGSPVKVASASSKSLDKAPKPTSSPVVTSPHRQKSADNVPKPTSSPNAMVPYVPRPTSRPDHLPKPTASPSAIRWQHKSESTNPAIAAVKPESQKTLRGDKALEDGKSNFKDHGSKIFHTLHHGSLRASIVWSGVGLRWDRVTWEGSALCTDELKLGPLFSIVTSTHNNSTNLGVISSDQCKVVKSKPTLAIDNRHEAIGIDFSCPQGLHVTWSARMQVVTGNLGVALRTHIQLSGNLADRTINSLATLLTKPGCVDPEPMGSVNGSPVKAGAGRFILALEHPLANHFLTKKEYAVVAEISNLEQLRVLGAPLRYSSVVLAVKEPDSQVRRVFARYLESVRPQNAWQGPMTHYNSWFDFASWQEGPAMDPNDMMCEAGALKRLKGFHALTERGAKFDSFVLDDGWDDRHTIWEVDHKKFPNGLQPVAEEAQNLGAGLGIWLSPWGGYGNDKKDRLEASKAFGYERNDQGLTLSGKRYAARFREVMLSMRRVNHVNMFKIDGFQAQGEDDLSLEVETILRIMEDVRKDALVDSQPGKKKDKKKDKPFWINLTTGTWPSPFFLMWVDSIWRGGGDLGVVDWPSTDGLNVRQRWQIYRECTVHDNIVGQGQLFPISRLMVHGVVLGQHGESPYRGLNETHHPDMETHADGIPFDWAQEVWSLAALGFQLQELYISPNLMTDYTWDELAKALTWSRAKAQILQDTHWVLPANCAAAKAKSTKFEPYAAASWNPEAAEGFIFLRNPMHEIQKVPLFSLAKAFELPSDASRVLYMKIVRKISGEKLLQFLGYSLDTNLDCDGLAEDAEERNPGVCAVSSTAMLQLEMTHGEVLILQAWSPSKPGNDVTDPMEDR